MSKINPCLVIPVYNHERALSAMLKGVLGTRLPIILVNDGSADPCRMILEVIAAENPEIYLLSLPENLGKGGAVKAGFIEADRKGYSHALQLDADGQHAVEDIAEFIYLGEKSPDAIICGCPIYDESVPKLRYYARYLTHVWIWINSLSFTIKDSMCGFRLYPLPLILKIIRSQTTGNRMDFDPEIMVRWVWSGGQVINKPTTVLYPDDGISHFLPCLDNALISKMHAKLFFMMLSKLPILLLNKMRGH